MSKHKVGDKNLRHSIYGVGEIVGVRVEMETPKEYDPVKLDGERWNLRARLAEIDRILERGSAPRPVDVYKVKHARGDEIEYGDLGIDKLKERFPGDAPEGAGD